MLYEHLSPESQAQFQGAMQTYAKVNRQRSALAAKEEIGRDAETYVIFTRLDKDTWRVVDYDAFLVAGFYKMDPMICELWEPEYNRYRGIVYLDIADVLMTDVSVTIAKIPRNVAFIGSKGATTEPRGFFEEFEMRNK